MAKEGKDIAAMFSSCQKERMTRRGARKGMLRGRRLRRGREGEKKGTERVS